MPISPVGFGTDLLIKGMKKKVFTKPEGEKKVLNIKCPIASSGGLDVKYDNLLKKKNEKKRISKETVFFPPSGITARINEIKKENLFKKKLVII